MAITFENLIAEKETIARMLRVRGEQRVGSVQTQFSSEIKIRE